MVVLLSQLFRTHHSHTNTCDLAKKTHTARRRRHLQVWVPPENIDVGYTSLMASIFTFDSEPSRVSSPWLTPSDSPKPSAAQFPSRSDGANKGPLSGLLADYGITRLEPEPQEGPTEYKLHLLLRPRRNYSYSSTGIEVYGSQRALHRLAGRNATLISAGDVPIPLASSNQSRMNRLQQLITQLLWRLQQSSPYHASSSTEKLMAQSPNPSANEERTLRPDNLLAGLEDSRGALYEIGVSDDGTLIGLTEEEMGESLSTLETMASNLGCKVEVVRMVIVGDCEWVEPALEDTETAERHCVEGRNGPGVSNDKLRQLYRRADLWVAEARITPDLSSRATQPAPIPLNGEEPHLGSLVEKQIGNGDTMPHGQSEQVRVTFTGPTTSGKSSLLGTLSTATLDNGRGKSRLSLLRHRHEIASGLTSSLAQELIGYTGEDVVNYASGNVSSWTDIHASCHEGRLVFISDSAGHPRYRRTTVRGLVGWAPHWTVLCVAADDGENAPVSAGGTSTSQDILGTHGAGVDLTQAHLDLCLKLGQPLVIAITKLDLASNLSLRKTLSKVLSAVKAAGRTPSILPPDTSKITLGTSLSIIPSADQDTIKTLVDKMTATKDFATIVPIVMTSAAKGTGIRLTHALLQYLPAHPAPTSQDFVGPALNPEQPVSLFHIEDVFDLPASYKPLAVTSDKQADAGSVVAGHLRFGRLSIGDAIVVGPFPAVYGEHLPVDSNVDLRSSPNRLATSSDHSPLGGLTRSPSRNAISASVTTGQWFNARIVSIRNLRLPVITLEAGQTGTIGLIIESQDDNKSEGTPERLEPDQHRLRKGMVLAVPTRHMLQTGHTLQAASGFTASLKGSDFRSLIPGSIVVAYIASIRASARVLSVVPDRDMGNTTHERTEGLDYAVDMFDLEDTADTDGPDYSPGTSGSDRTTDVIFELMTNREWIELGSQVLVMPGGGQGLYYGIERGEKGIAGLEGYVGKVVEVVD